MSRRAGDRRSGGRGWLERGGGETRKQEAKFIENTYICH